MHYFSRLTLLSVFAAATLADLATSLPSRQDEVVLKYTSDTIPVDWVTLGDPPIDITIDLHFALKPYHENTLIGALNEVKVCNPMHRKHVLSNIFPRHLHSYVSFYHCRYGTHLSREQIDELVAPHLHAFERVTSWLHYRGVPSSSISMIHGGGWLTVADVPVSQANKLLSASYQLYRHSGTNDTTILRTVSYGLPAMLHKYMETVVPTMCFASTRTLWQTPRRRSVEVRDSEPVLSPGEASTTGADSGSETAGSGCDNGDKALRRWNC